MLLGNHIRLVLNFESERRSKKKHREGVNKFLLSKKEQFKKVKHEGGSFFYLYFWKSPPHFEKYILHSL